MAKYDYGGGCACGLQAECDCEHGGKTMDDTDQKAEMVSAEYKFEDSMSDLAKAWQVGDVGMINRILRERFGAQTGPIPYTPGERQAYPSLSGEGMLHRPITHKDTNPKDAVGTKKSPMSVVPMGVMMEVGVGMLEGARKYGRHNYRVSGVRASVYVDATMRHLMKFWDFGIDIDPDSGLSEITKAITSLVVLRDSMMNGNWVDDRPPPLPISLLEEIQKAVDGVFARYPNALPAYTHESVKTPEEK
jgi:Domain of unknown function (DUF5664)